MITINIILYNINNNEIPPDLKLLTSLSVFVTYLLIKRIFKYNIYYKKKKKIPLTIMKNHLVYVLDL